MALPAAALKRHSTRGSLISENQFPVIYIPFGCRNTANLQQSTTTDGLFVMMPVRLEKSCRCRFTSLSKLHSSANLANIGTPSLKKLLPKFNQIPTAIGSFHYLYRMRKFCLFIFLITASIGFAQSDA